MTEEDYKKYVKIYARWMGAIFAAICVLLGIIYIIDPVQLFHKSSTNNTHLLRDMRVQAAGIIKNFDIDSLILGTSQMENSSASEAAQKLGGKFFNVSISGGTYPERAIILRKALKRPIKNVIYSLDDYYVDLRDSTEHLRPYLYDDNPINDIKYYLSPQTLKKVFYSDGGLTKMDMDRPNAWVNDATQINRFGGMAHWTDHRDDAQIHKLLCEELPEYARKFAGGTPPAPAHDLAREADAKKYVDENLLALCREHPEANFYLIIPPYFRLYYAIWRRFAPENFYLHQEVIRHLVSESAQLKNVHIYGFEDQDFLDHIANYKDAKHFHPRFNSMFITAIATGQHELTPANVEAYLRRCAQKAWDFDIPALNAAAQAFLASPPRQESRQLPPESH